MSFSRVIRNHRTNETRRFQVDETISDAVSPLNPGREMALRL